jgi:hypothetical protein
VPQAAAPPRPRVVLRQVQNLPEVGLHRYPSERKGRRRPGSQPARPFSRPQPPQNAAKVRGFSRTVSAFTAETDCLLEESRFEPLVPPRWLAPGYNIIHKVVDLLPWTKTRAAADKWPAGFSLFCSARQPFHEDGSPSGLKSGDFVVLFCSLFRKFSRAHHVGRTAAVGLGAG